MSKFLFFYFLFTTASFANELNNRSWLSSYKAVDVNSDRKVDYWVKTEKSKIFIVLDRNNDKRIDSKLILVKEGGVFKKSDLKKDNNFDFKWDSFKEFTPIPKLSSDKNFDGKIDFKEEFLKYRGGTIKKISRDSNFDGVFDKVSVKRIHLKSRAIQGELSCESLSGIDQILKLEKFAKEQANIPLSTGEWTTTNYGLRVHSSCFEYIGDDKLDFLNSLDNTLMKGARCLAGLETNKSKDLLISYVSNLLENQASNKVKLSCEEKSGDFWDGIRAVATVPGEDEHPLVRLNPDDFVDFFDDGTLGPTVFHEMMHLDGSIHTADEIEVPYACEGCCMDTASSSLAEGVSQEDLKKVACRICQGDYTDPTDPKYTKDLVELFRMRKLKGNAIEYALSMNALYPDDKAYVNLLIGEYVGYSDPLALALSIEATKNNVTLDKNLLDKIDAAKDDPVSQDLLAINGEFSRLYMDNLNKAPIVDVAKSLLEKAKLKAPQSEFKHTQKYQNAMFDLIAFRRSISLNVRNKLLTRLSELESLESPKESQLTELEEVEELLYEIEDTRKLFR